MVRADRAAAGPRRDRLRVQAQREEGTSPYTIRHLGSLCALDRRSGRIVWRWPVPALPGVVQAGFAAGPALDGGTLVIGGLDGSLYAFRAG